MKRSTKHIIGIILLWIFVFVLCPDSFGQTAQVQVGKETKTVQVTDKDCDCAVPMKETKTVTQGKRGGLYCWATKVRGKNKGQRYKRYFKTVKL